jgi:alpha-L-arabinofuranosidase
MFVQAQINVNVNAGLRGDTISEKQYGIFFEEINHAGDGGLYAETVRNRSFEGEFEPAKFWDAYRSAKLTLEKADATHSNMLSQAQGYAMKVTTTAAESGLYNEGYVGINIVNGRQYKLSLWAKGTTNDIGLTAKLLSSDLKSVLGSVKIGALNNSWTKYSTTITATGDDTKGVLAITADNATTFYVDIVSLMPPTFKGRENGCRQDVAQMLADLNPQIMRFPGGCYVEGLYNSNTKKNYRYEWKNTLGNIEDRLPQYNNNWGYDVNNGLGIYEFFQFCEDIKARPLYVVNIGLGHGWTADYDAELNQYIQEALDLIEFANDDSTTTYGKIRKQMGHEAPFNLRLMEIGNENWGFDHYVDRYRAFRKAILAKYPYMELITNGYDNTLNDDEVEYVDEHYYSSPDWFIGQYNRYDGNDKTGHKKVYVGEYAVTQDWGNDKGDIKAALGEAVFMQGMEKNSAYVKMASYAPIFYADDAGGYWKPDMLHFNAAAAYGTPSFYIQKLFANNIGQCNIDVSETGNAINRIGSIGVGTWKTAATFSDIKVTDNTTGKVLLTEDFANGTDNWTPNSTTWSVKDGVLTQSDDKNAPIWDVYSKADLTTRHYTYELSATKTSGDEGFVIPFNFINETNYSWFNVGGWGNTATGIEQCANGNRGAVSGTVAGKVNTGQTYKIKIVVDSLNVQAYIDGTLVQTVKLKAVTPRSIFTSANIDAAQNVVYLRIVNPYADAQTLRVNLKNAVIGNIGGQMLSGTSATDENTPDKPENIVPKDITGISATDNGFTFEAKPYAAYFLKIGVSNVTPQQPEQVVLPQATLKYDFEEGAAVDSSKTFEGSFVSEAKIETMSDNNHVLYTGPQGKGGYMDLGADVAKTAWAPLNGDYSVSVDLMFADPNNLGQYCWPYAFCAGTNKYVAMVNAAGNGNWYYEIKNGTAIPVRSGSSLGIGSWHNVTFVQSENTGIIYVDGRQKGSTAVSTFPADIASSLTNAYFGKSPFGGDAVMENMYLDNFAIYNTALSSDQVKALWTKTSSLSKTLLSTGIVNAKTSTKSNTAVYTINGKKVSSDTRNVRNLPKGIYIYGNKKHLVR